MSVFLGERGNKTGYNHSLAGYLLQNVHFGDTKATKSKVQRRNNILDLRHGSGKSKDSTK